MDAGADAVHPGWGFLAEVPDLSRRCAAAGITFVGPDAAALELFGDKTRTRERARDAGVPVLAATAGDTSDEEARAFLRGLGDGAAVMVKALAGGGGRGLQPVRDEADLARALERCRSEARGGTGRGEVYVEQLLTGARHVEVQLLGDGEEVAVLGDRDCSVQRRRQKLVEVAPAPGLAPELRERLGQAAAAVVGTGYRGLATAEFLVRGEELFLLEVNPRLQVEHTVTEEVTGLDLVELALRVAGGARLADLELGRLLPTGTAVQARVNAETLLPDGSVRPSAGVLERFVPPAGRGVRVDTAAAPGDRVDPRFDTLLAKVVVHEPRGDLARTLAAAARAVEEFDVAGPPTTLPLLARLLRAADLAAGRVTTDWLDAHLPELLPDAPGAPAPARAEVDGVAVTAPLSGSVVEVAAAVGEPVAAGAAVLVLEAMKMEHVVTAPAGGV